MPDTYIGLERIMGRVMDGVREGVNEGIDLTARYSQEDVPKGTSGQLRKSMEKDKVARVPYADIGSLSVRGKIRVEGMVSYNTPYAAAQHEGHMSYLKLTKGRTVRRKRIEWRVSDYTTPGTGSQFLSDPLKIVAGMLETMVATKVEEKLL